MQLFGLDPDPAKAAAELCDIHVNSQLRETAQILHTALYQWNVVPVGLVDCTAFGHGHRKPYRPMSPNHPCVRWAAGARTHFEWVTKHGIALANEWETRSGKIHESALFIMHIVKHVERYGWPEFMPETATPDEWFESMECELGWADDKWAEWRQRVATQNAPDGCEFGILGFDLSIDHTPDDWVASYETYYGWKKSMMKRPMKWSAPGELGAKKRKRESHEEVAIA